ncbi:carboxymuconolactone decarboxylase family protein [Actinophytocola sp.]|uniref:carboxymuconolactone decarboxylase family protein n=1 Tax=Actinophytocola sp. TaxID=1872138 RepID=UPI00389A05E4
MTPRLQPLRPSELTPEQAEVYERIVGGPRGGGPRLFDLTDAEGRLNGPFNAMLLAPALGDALQELGARVRYRTSLPDRIREMAILAVATRWRSDFERYAHEAIGRAAGLTEDEIRALREESAPRPEDPHEAAALDLVRSLLVGGDLDDDAWSAARAELSEVEVFELTTLVGYYVSLALLMRVFRVGLPE